MIKELTKKEFNKETLKDIRIAIVTSSYHYDLTGCMQDKCIETLVSAGVLKDNIDVLKAPGSWEIGVISNVAAKSGKYSGIATFGVIVKGETYHFDMIANEVGRILMDIATRYDIPVAMEILATYTLEQAKVRASDDEYNKGIEAANALLETIQTLEGI